MSTSSAALSNEGTPTYLATSDPDRRVTDFASNTTAARDYFPVWLIRTLYEDQQFSFAGPYGADGFLEVYNTRVRGEPIGGVVLVDGGLPSDSWRVAE
jgi:hypothetical protein